MPSQFLPGRKALCALFMAATAAMANDALAVTGRDHPKVGSGRHLPGVKAPAKGKGPPCVQAVPARRAAPNGYTSAYTMRRTAALGQIYGEDAAAAIAIASYETGIDFDLLVMKAMLESRMGKYDEPLLGGSARGLFHFMPATWLTLFSWFGNEFQGGIYADVAAMIKFDEQKNPYTDNPALTEKILALRSDPYVAAFIKAKSVRYDERPLMRAVLGREPTYTDYYVAHFLGLERAKTFFRALRKTPKEAAADIFVKESEDPNNRPIFYSGDKKRTVQEVYNRLGKAVSGTLARIDSAIAAEMKRDRCIPLLPLIPPPRAAMAIPPMPEQPVLPPGGETKPPVPGEEQAPEPGPPAPDPDELNLGASRLSAYKKKEGDMHAAYPPSP